MSDWFEQWFGEEYLNLYPHRDEEDARRAIELVAGWVPLAGRSVLDLACGPGRHAFEMSGQGARVVGFDLSMPLLSRARHGEPHILRLVRGDMRVLPFGAAVFDTVVNLFTSFGYFDSDGQHDAVLREVARILRPDGSFVLDYLNADRVRSHLVAHEERTLGGQAVIINRALTPDGRFVEKEMHLAHDGRRFLERVRLFSPDELTRIVDRAGMRVLHVAGDYEGGELAPESPRCIVAARRS